MARTTCLTFSGYLFFRYGLRDIGPPVLKADERVSSHSWSVPRDEGSDQSTFAIATCARTGNAWPNVMPFLLQVARMAELVSSERGVVLQAESTGSRLV